MPDITGGHIGRVLCVRQENVGEDYVCVSHPRTPGVIDKHLAAIYIWDFAHEIDSVRSTRT